MNIKLISILLMVMAGSSFAWITTLSTGEDAHINGKATTLTWNYGGSDPIQVGTGSGGRIYRGLVRFPGVETMPEGAVADSANLYFYVTAAPGGQDLSAYPLRVDWVAGSQDGAASTTTVTWNITKSSTPWTTAGAASTTNDYHSTPRAQKNFSAAGLPYWDRFRVEDAVNDWLDGSKEHHGFLILDDTEAGNQATTWHSFEGTNTPYLIIYYHIPPQLTGLSDAAQAGAAQDRVDTVSITYEVYDPDHANHGGVDTVKAQYCLTSNDCSAGGAGWTNMTDMTGDVGVVDASSSTQDREILWDVGSGLPTNTENTYKIRLIAVDDSASADTVESADFTVDTKDPTGLAGFSIDDMGTTEATVSWSGTATDANFSHYEIWYSTNKTNTEARNASAIEWDDADDANLATASTAGTAVTVLAYNTKYYFKIWAVDAYGNEMTLPTDSGITLTSEKPLVTGPDPEPKVTVLEITEDSIEINYEVDDLDDSVVTITVETKLASQGSFDTWATVGAFVSGSTGDIVTSPNTDRLIIWDLNAHHGPGDVSETAQVRVIAVDSNNNADTSTSASFIVDNKNPNAFASGLTSPSQTSSEVTLNWGVSADDNFSHYEIWYGTNQTTVENRTSAEWDNDPQDANLANVSTTSTTITGLTANTTFYFRIYAVDDFGNATFATTLTQATDATTSLQITNIVDNVIRNDNTTQNCGGDGAVGGPTAGSKNGYANSVKRGLVYIDVSGVPTGATISSATFSANLNDGDVTSRTIQAYPLTYSFVEGSALCATQAGSSTWISRGPENWTSPGGDYGASAASTAVTDLTGGTGSSSSYDWDLTSIVQSWVDGTTNNGLIFINDVETGTSGKIFDGTEGAVPPQLLVDYVLNYPVVTGLSAAALVGATMAGDPDSVTVSYEVSDADDATVDVTLQWKLAVGGSWVTAANVTGYVGSGLSAASSTIDREIRWGAKLELGDVDNNYKVRVIANDGTLADTTESAPFAIDTKPPVGLANFNVVAPTPSAINLDWTAVTDETNFNHYEIWYGSNLTEVQNRTGSAIEFDDTDDTGLNSVLAASTSIPGVNSSTLYYLKIWAVDDNGNEATTAFDSVTTPEDAAPTVTGLAAAAQIGSYQMGTDVIATFEVADSDGDSADCYLQYYQAGPWSNATTVSGNTGGVKYTAGQDLAITWDVGTDLPSSTDATFKTRIHCTDVNSNADTTESAVFVIDRVAPTGMAGFAVGTMAATTADLSWTAVTTENHFSHYEIWYGTNQSDVQNRTGTALEWDNDNDASLATMATTSTTVTSLTPASTFYFKLWGVDSAGNEQTLTDDNGITLSTNAPVVTGPSDTPEISASQSSTTQVSIVYEMDDSDTSPTVTMDAEYCLASGDCSPGGSWVTLTNRTGNIGAVAPHPTTDRTITWTAASQSPLQDVEDNYKVRVIADDGDGGTVNDTTNSATFALDTKPPTSVGAILALVEAGGTTMELSWTASTDANFNHYEIWYGPTSGNVTSRSGDAAEWDNGDDASLATATTTSTIVTGLTINSTYYWRIWAVDDVGNEISNSSNLNANTLDIKTPVVTLDASDDLGAIQGISIAGNNLYIGSANVGGGEDNMTKRDADNGSFRWSFSTAAYGACNAPIFSYDGSVNKYVIHFSAGSRFFGVQDDGGGAKTNLFNISLGSNAGTPYGSPGDNRIALVAGGNLHLREYRSGAAASEWSSVSGSFEPTADLVFDTWTQNAVYVGATNGDIHAYKLADGTTLAGPYTAGTGSPNSVLWQAGNGYIYVVIGSQLHKINEATMSNTPPTGFPVNLGGTGIGLWYDWNTDIIYVTTSAGVNAIKNADGTNAVSPRSLANIASPPTVNGNVIYFGMTGGKYYAISRTTLSDMTSWPYTVADGDATAWPAMDISNGRVIFGTDSENLDSFTQE